MNIATLRDARLRALTLGELLWSDVFVQLCEDVEEAIGETPECDSVSTLAADVRDLKDKLERERDSATDAARDLAEEEDQHAETRQELARMANRVAELESGLPKDVGELHARCVELEKREAFARRELSSRLTSYRALVASCRKAVNLLTPKRRLEFVKSPEADAYTDALAFPVTP